MPLNSVYYAGQSYVQRHCQPIGLLLLRAELKLRRRREWSRASASASLYIYVITLSKNWSNNWFPYITDMISVSLTLFRIGQVNPSTMTLDYRSNYAFFTYLFLSYLSSYRASISSPHPHQISHWGSLYIIYVITPLIIRSFIHSLTYPTL